MDRCKLEYMIKRFDFNEKKRIIMEMDPYGDYKFKKDISRYLLDPDTKDEDVLMYIGPYTTMYFVSNKDEEFKELMEQELEEIKEEYINQYKLINELCIKNNTYPFFEDPTDIKECEKTRLDIVRIIPEKIINKFFKVDSLRDYEPPMYKKKED